MANAEKLLQIKMFKNFFKLNMVFQCRNEVKHFLFKDFKKFPYSFQNYGNCYPQFLLLNANKK